LLSAHVVSQRKLLKFTMAVDSNSPAPLLGLNADDDFSPSNQVSTDEDPFSDEEEFLDDLGSGGSPPQLGVNVDPDLPSGLNPLRLRSISNVKDSSFDLGLSEDDLLGGSSSASKVGSSPGTVILHLKKNIFVDEEDVCAYC
jgi:hypothetical protein